jgi:hypothetical protein
MDDNKETKIVNGPDSMDILSASLGIDNMVEVYDVVPVSQQVPESDTKDDDKSDLDSDFLYARKNIKDAIDKTKDAIDDMIQVGKKTELPGPYDVANKLLTSVIAASTELMNMHKKVKEIKSKDKQGDSGASTGTTNNTQNNVFIGTTSELQEMLKQKKLGTAYIENKKF